jgi:hypothetical protein
MIILPLEKSKLILKFGISRLNYYFHLESIYFPLGKEY